MVAEIADELGVVDGTDAVPDAGGTQFDGLPDAVRAGGFAGVGDELESLAVRVDEDVAKHGDGTASFVAADSEADDGAIHSRRGQFGDLLGRFDTKLADGIENVTDRNLRLRGFSVDGVEDRVRGPGCARALRRRRC